MARSAKGTSHGFGAGFGPRASRAALTSVFGGGGVFGIAYNLGVAHALVDSGIGVDRDAMLGTSAGSWCAAALACGVGYDELAAIDVPRVPNLTRGLLARVARDVFGERTDDRVRATSVMLRNGRRCVLGGDGTPLADLCAASSAVPGLFAPHVIGGARYVDGGVKSAIHLDATDAADLLVVITPIGGRVLGVVGSMAERLARRELTAWERRHAGAARMCRPGRDIAAIVGSNPLNLFDAGRALAVYPAAYDQGRAFAGLLVAEGLVPALRRAA